VPLRDRMFESLIVFRTTFVDESALRLGDVTIRSVNSPQATNYPDRDRCTGSNLLLKSSTIAIALMAV